MAIIEVDVDINIEEHLDEVSTQVLIEELNDRGYYKISNNELIGMVETILRKGSLNQAIELSNRIKPIYNKLI